MVIFIFVHVYWTCKDHVWIYIFQKKMWYMIMDWDCNCHRYVVIICKSYPNTWIIGFWIFGWFATCECIISHLAQHCSSTFWLGMFGIWSSKQAFFAWRAALFVYEVLWTINHMHFISNTLMISNEIYKWIRVRLRQRDSSWLIASLVPWLQCQFTC